MTHTDASHEAMMELLERLDPEPAPTCAVPGCLHLHVSAETPLLRAA
jgi:hypothetical protein